MLLLGSGVATTASADTFDPKPDPNAAPSTRPAAGPEKEVRAGARPVSGKKPSAGPAWKQVDEGLGTWSVNTRKVQLRNTVTDADGDKANLTFEVWTVDSGGKPKTKVKIEDNEYGVKVSGYVSSGSAATVTVDPKWLNPNVDYVFHTSAYDGSLYETSWSPWARLRIELPVDLALPAPVHDAPNPGFTTAPNSKQTKPLASGGVTRSTYKAQKQCGPVGKDGRRVCIAPTPAKPAKSKGTRDVGWCENGAMGAYADRFKECDTRPVTYWLGPEDDPIAKADFNFTRTLRLDGPDSFTETLTIKGVNIPADFDGGISLSAFNGHICQGSCKPIEPQGGDWTATPTWRPGDTHSASLTTKYTWDASSADMTYRYKPDVKIEGTVHSPGIEQKVDYQWSKGYWQDTRDLDQIRCDTFKTKWGSTGCVFVNSAPTYVFNAKRYPQAAAHAWLIQTVLPNHAGSEAQDKPLYYMGDSAQNTRNRDRICPDRWAAENGDASALDDATDKLNCDEFAFASSYNSGGMKKSEGGLNEAVPTGSTTGIPNGSACVQSFAKKHGTKVHLYNIDNGKVPTFNEVCGRSSISGIHNQESMGGNFTSFMKQMRIMDKDAYWLNTRMTGSCAATDAFGKPVNPVICTMTAK
ncbi:hypothetical protein OG905_00910 [Streptomyces sp. NBC_00322]|uniref:hypothetical protein n=1 Tax=Streptomyces sp. NBC_00322 TaxID=2975712 RepID=UPI002E2C85F3|nr:hypothetical protein [Streptomyces sp. NBC_00322]